MELMVGLGLSGIVFMIMVTLMGQSATFSSVFHGTANSIEAVSATVRQLNTVMPQVVNVASCGCRGANSTNLSNCTWSDGQPWFDPHYNGGVSAGTEHLLFDGYFESYDGDDVTDDGVMDLSRSAAEGRSWAANLGGCFDYDESLGTWVSRGCKQRVRLYYTSATQASGGTPSNAGVFRLKIGTAADPAGNFTIGGADRDGLNGVGVVRVSCGFVQGTGGQAGLLFVLNVRLKSRSTTSQNTAHSLYESWYEGGANYNKGRFREVQMKFAFPNVSYRGVYQWRTAAQKNCKENGESVSPGGSKEECCSLAMSGTTCTSCIRSGQGGTATSCCSGKVSGGTCI